MEGKLNVFVCVIEANEIEVVIGRSENSSEFLFGHSNFKSFHFSPYCGEYVYF